MARYPKIETAVATVGPHGIDNSSSQEQEPSGLAYIVFVDCSRSQCFPAGLGGATRGKAYESFDDSR